MKLRIQSCRPLPGFAGGLTERSALVEIAIEGDVGDALANADRLRAGAVSFCPDEHFYEIAGNDWPTAFLVPDAETGGATRWLGEWVVALTIAAQRWGHDAVYRGRVLAAEPDRLWLAIPWRREALLRDSLEMALQLIAAWARDEPDRAALRRIDRAFRAGLDAAQAGGLIIDTVRFVESAARQGIPFDIAGGVIQLGWGASAEYLDGTVTGDTGVLAAATARNKALANRRLAAAGVPVPGCRVASNPAQVRAAAAELGWPVVVKPLGLDSGLGVEPGIADNTRLERAAEVAARMGRGTVLVEEHVEGLCYRLLVVHGELLAAVRRVPAGVVGDGRHSVAELMERANAEPRRSTFLHRMVIDSVALGYLTEQRLRPDSVPAAGRQVWLRRTAYSETGGHHENVTDEVHPDNRALALRVARLVRLDIAGIDLLTTDITRSWRDVGGAVCEVNAQPSLMPHWIAEPGRDINGEVLGILFGSRSPRIPTAAVAGPGADMVATLVHRIWGAAGRVAGLSCADVVRIGDDVIAEGMSGCFAAKAVLAEPDVEAAVFSVSADRVAAEGHGADRYDVVAVCNDGSGPCPEILARAGSAVVLDADDAQSPAESAVRCIRVARDSDQVAGAGDLVHPVVHDGRTYIVFADGDRECARIAVAEPGQQALFAAAVAWAHGIDAAAIEAGLAECD